MTNTDLYLLFWTASCFAILTDLLYACSLDGVRFIDRRRGRTERNVDTKALPLPLPLALYKVVCASAATLLHVSHMCLTVLFCCNLPVGSLGFRYSGLKGGGKQKIRNLPGVISNVITKHHQHSNIAPIDVTVCSKCICLYFWLHHLITYLINLY